MEANQFLGKMAQCIDLVVGQILIVPVQLAADHRIIRGFKREFYLHDPAATGSKHILFFM